MNVYLEVASIVGPPFTWAKFDKLAAACARTPVPCTTQPEIDSLRVVAMCTSGRFAGDDPVEVWTNAHIDTLVHNKAMHPVVPDTVTGRRGLGWTDVDARGLVAELIDGVTSRSGGGTLGDGGFPDGNPPLDHEDGMVYGACRTLSGDDPVASVFCVTRDHGFLDAYRNDRLSGHSRVVSPPQMAALMRAARTRHSTARMRPST